ncbi:MAG: EAL and HDOD domain-containing protein [Inhella sp.]|jgi:EAL and modified HD-GYP domain-containing signal transduction protein|uniref:EAL and HDOD domain-containing protein n=1 Tax=Inhella sp. TaxID=1921806 RepID=UPI00391AC2B1
MSLKHPILAQVALGYAPLYDAQRQVMATRLTLVPLKPDVALDPAEVLAVALDACPASHRPVILNVPHEATLAAVARCELPPHLSLEVPAFLAGSMAEALLSCSGQLLKGVSDVGALRSTFKATELDLDDLRRGVTDPNRLPLWCNVVRSAPEAAEAFQRGAQAVFGLPVEGAYEPPAGSPKVDVSADLQVLMQLIGQVDRGEAPDRLEATLKRDPSLAFKLLRYMNSAAFGLPVEVTSFRHAMMLLGLARLKRWLALLLATACKDNAMRPVMWAALRRGLLMEELARGLNDREAQDEMFICGLFSLLDHLLKSPFDKLLASVPCPERVVQALVHHTGPYQPYLDMARAIESESPFDHRDAAAALMLGPAEVNQAVVVALAKGAQLD